MPRLFEIVTDLQSGADCLRRRRYGVIDVEDGRLVHVRLRPFAKLAWLPEILLGQRHHDRIPGDRCRLYYNQPRGHENFLALRHVVSSRDGTLASFREALRVLDEIARIKSADALLCDVQNPRISSQMLNRQGWQPHCPRRWHRNYIKRFYGNYPAATADARDERGELLGVG